MALTALAMSGSKEELVRILDLDAAMYRAMHQETDRVYKELTTNPENLRSNSKQHPPYDWSDITDQAKEKAIIRLAQSGDEHTSKKWALAKDGNFHDSPNWIARWFLYHTFRYRDGRNRGRETKSAKSSSSSSKSKHKKHSSKSSSVATPMLDESGFGEDEDGGYTWYPSTSGRNRQPSMADRGSLSPDCSSYVTSTTCSNSSPTESSYSYSYPPQGMSRTKHAECLSQEDFYDPVREEWTKKRRQSG